MEEARKDQAAIETKGPETDSKPVSGDSKPDSSAAAATGASPRRDTGTDGSKESREGTNQSASQGGANQDAAKAATEAPSKKPAGDSAKEAAGNSNGESGGKSPDQSEAAGSEAPALDAKTQKLVEAKIDARMKSLLESELEPLLAVNRQLARFLREQMEIAIELRQSVVAMERLIEVDTRRKSKYAAMLDKVKGEGDGMKDPHWINRTRGMLSQLERTGTTGPKIEGETSQN